MPTVQAGYGRLITYVTEMPSSLSEVRSPLLSSVRVLLIRRFGVTWWSSRSSAQIVALCLDSSNINDQINHSVEGSFLCRLETLGRRLCHKLHMKRLQLYQKIFQKIRLKYVNMAAPSHEPKM